MQNEEFATYKVIKTLMHEMNINKHELSKETGLNYDTLRGYIDSGNNIPLEALKKIAKALNVSVAYLIGETKIKKFDDNKILYESCIKMLNDFMATSK